MQIRSLSESPSPRTALEAAEAIFFESSSKKVFSDEAERLRFRERYFGVYTDRDPEWFLLAHDDHASVLGYLAGAPDTREEHLALNPYLGGFRREIVLYPAHLHINFSPEARGLGLGSLLISEFERRLKDHSIPGVHLVTGATERNVGFYNKNGYLEASRIRVGSSELVLLGKRL
jgi:ribosomal protein S18 acetylase RimI-like enzyme